MILLEVLKQKLFWKMIVVGLAALGVFFIVMNLFPAWLYALILFCIAGCNWSATRGATFAIRKGKFGLYYTGMALCGKKDNFNRKIGRTIATQRLEKSKLWHSRRSLHTVIDDIRGLCAKHGYIIPVSSLQYIEETFNGKKVQVRRPD